MAALVNKHAVLAIGTAAAIGAVVLYRHLRRSARLFVCGQQTVSLNSELAGFVGMRTVTSVKAAMPPFNRRESMQLYAGTVEFNAPVFGPSILNATMALFDSPEMAALAAELGVRVPQYQLSTFVQKKAAKVKVLVEAARARADCGAGANATAVENLANFVAAFEKLTPASVPDLKSWRTFCDGHCPAGWEEHLHFDHVLTFCFGFEPATAKALRVQKHSETDPKTGRVETKDLENYSVRWLAKALGAYGPEGCLGDVVNLALAMLHAAPPADMSEGAIVFTLSSLKEVLDGPTFSGDGLWIPTHLCHDGESDDTLSWLLLERVRRKLGVEPLRVLAQLPTDARLDGAAAHFVRKGCAVFRDDDSRNAEAALKNLGHL